MSQTTIMRRTVLRGLGGALAIAALPAVRAQAPGPRRVAVFHWLDRRQYGQAYPRFFPTLAGKGWKEGSNIAFEWQGIRVDETDIAAPALRLVATRPDAILTESTRATRALSNATRTIPIVTFVGDPVGGGFSTGIGTPGRNVTGTCICGDEGAPRLIALLKSMAPKVSVLGIAYSSRYSISREQAQPLMTAAAQAGITPRLLLVPPEDIEGAIRRAVQGGVQALVAGNLVDPENFRKAGEAARNQKIPAIGGFAEHKEVFVLTVEATHLAMDRSMALALDKVLRGENPAQLPWVQPDGSILIVNRRIAKAIGVEIPPDMLIRANEVLD
jgi:putative ABC transport system substrate-binding protein